MMVAGHVQVVLDAPAVPDGLRAALEHAGVSASFEAAEELLRQGVESRADAVVVVASDRTAGHPGRIRALLERIAGNPRATLVLHTGGAVAQAGTHPPALPVSYVCEAGSDDLAARIVTMVSMRGALDALRRRPVPPARERIIEQYHEQLRRAARVQHELFAAQVPACDALRIRTLYKPLEYVSGDLYDVCRLDREHVAIALADAQGHGVSAALLTVFIKRIWQAETDATGSAGMGMELPRQVLRRLNRELIEADLSDFQFVSVAYAVIHLPTGRATLARGGAPYPILRRASGVCEMLRPVGPLVGVVDDATFELRRFRLRRGDTLVFYSDGVEALSAPPGGRRPLPPEIAPDQAVTIMPWFRELREVGVDGCLSFVAARHDTLRRVGRPLDDVTILTATWEP